MHKKDWGVNFPICVPLMDLYIDILHRVFPDMQENTMQLLAASVALEYHRGLGELRPFVLLQGSALLSRYSDLLGLYTPEQRAPARQALIKEWHDASGKIQKLVRAYAMDRTVELTQYQQAAAGHYYQAMTTVFDYSTILAIASHPMADVLANYGPRCDEIMHADLTAEEYLQSFNDAEWAFEGWSAAVERHLPNQPAHIRRMLDFTFARYATTLDMQVSDYFFTEMQSALAMCAARTMNTEAAINAWQKQFMEEALDWLSGCSALQTLCINRFMSQLKMFYGVRPVEMQQLTDIQRRLSNAVTSSEVIRLMKQAEKIMEQLQMTPSNLSLGLKMH